MTAPDFARVAHGLQTIAIKRGLRPVAYRTGHGARTLRRTKTPVVRVNINRPVPEVVADMLAGLRAAQ